MSIHSDIQQETRRIIDESRHIDLLSPTFIATRVVNWFGEIDEAHLKWLSLEQAKQIARRTLAAKFDPDGDESDAYQGDMFSGLLQERYPTPIRDGGDPVYKPRHLLSVDEIDWNIAKLEKSADARRQHAAALRSFRDQVALAA